MSPITVILLAAVISGLVTALGYTIKGNLHLQNELASMRTELYRESQRLNEAESEYVSLLKEKVWMEGVQAGRTSDTLYQQILRKYTGDKQVTVMINGTKEDELK